MAFQVGGEDGQGGGGSYVIPTLGELSTYSSY